ncbi:hypothetical protein FRB94_008460 [Tulasnella sp. JGI-2019a]|nr:hypothetical protein FRB93_007687 [Tulasnella sp. JGI-2019a]KAG8996213.1 hypothetical protein FRB94_008460 [Tulasnella sp. JGI-2019a]KAG9024688.1 hypothetical protein FRB95_011175 [Tulasnella sp. JGI-2019a]
MTKNEERLRKIYVAGLVTVVLESTKAHVPGDTASAVSPPPSLWNTVTPSPEK